jgi:hypothetical protein
MQAAHGNPPRAQLKCLYVGLKTETLEINNAKIKNLRIGPIFISINIDLNEDFIASINIISILVIELTVLSTVRIKIIIILGVLY